MTVTLRDEGLRVEEPLPQELGQQWCAPNHIVACVVSFLKGTEDFSRHLVLVLSDEPRLLGFTEI